MIKTLMTLNGINLVQLSIEKPSAYLLLKA